MNLLFVDCEATGLDRDKDRAIEIAGVLYSVEHRCVLQHVSTVLDPGTATYGCEHIHGIPESALMVFSDDNDEHYQVSDSLVLWFEHVGRFADYVVAYNADFDKAFFKHLNLLQSCAWLDAMQLPWQHHKAQPSLIELCVAYGVPIVRAHRALDDCQLLSELIGQLPDIDAAIAYALQPNVTIKALVGYGNRQLAKDAGFAWD